jgi:hypothetical protein
MVPGWLGLAVLASATHLVPAIGPGDPAAHARGRRILGRLGGTRLVAADVGIGALALGIPADAAPAIATGLLLTGLSLGATALLLVVAVIDGLRSARATGNLVA